MRTETVTEDRDFWDEPLPPLRLHRALRLPLPARRTGALPALGRARALRRCRMPARARRPIA